MPSSLFLHCKVQWSCDCGAGLHVPCGEVEVHIDSAGMWGMVVGYLCVCDYGYFVCLWWCAGCVVVATIVVMYCV